MRASLNMGVVMACVATVLVGCASESVTSNASASPSTSTLATVTNPNVPAPAPTSQPSPVPLPTYTIQAGDGPPPALPEAVDGYVADGEISTFEVRVFGGGQASSSGTGGAGNACDLGYRVARWRTLGDLPILATPGYVNASSASDTTGVSLVLSDLDDYGAQIGTAGYLTGYR